MLHACDCSPARLTISKRSDHLTNCLLPVHTLAPGGQLGACYCPADPRPSCTLAPTHHRQLGTASSDPRISFEEGAPSEADGDEVHSFEVKLVLEYCVSADALLPEHDAMQSYAQHGLGNLDGGTLPGWIEEQ